MDSKGRGRGEGKIERHSSRPNEQRPGRFDSDDRRRIEQALMHEQRKAERRAKLESIIQQKEDARRRYWSTISDLERRMYEASSRNQTKKFIELERRKVELVLKVNQASTAIDDIRRQISNIY